MNFSYKYYYNPDSFEPNFKNEGIEFINIKENSMHPDAVNLELPHFVVEYKDKIIFIEGKLFNPLPLYNKLRRRLRRINYDRI